MSAANFLSQLVIAEIEFQISIYGQTSVHAVCSVPQSCLTLCDLMDCSLPGSSVHGILRQKYWSELPCPSAGDLPTPRIEPVFLVSPALAGGFFITEPPAKLKSLYVLLNNNNPNTIILKRTRRHTLKEFDEPICPCAF